MSHSFLLSLLPHSHAGFLAGRPLATQAVGQASQPASQLASHASAAWLQAQASPAQPTGVTGSFCHHDMEILSFPPPPLHRPNSLAHTFIAPAPARRTCADVFCRWRKMPHRAAAAMSQRAARRCATMPTHHVAADTGTGKHAAPRLFARRSSIQVFRCFFVVCAIS